MDTTHVEAGGMSELLEEIAQATGRACGNMMTRMRAMTEDRERAEFLAWMKSQHVSEGNSTHFEWLIWEAARCEERKRTHAVLKKAYSMIRGVQLEDLPSGEPSRFIDEELLPLLASLEKEDSHVKDQD